MPDDITFTDIIDAIEAQRRQGLSPERIRMQPWAAEKLRTDTHTTEIPADPDATPVFTRSLDIVEDDELESPFTIEAERPGGEAG